MRLIIKVMPLAQGPANSLPAFGNRRPPDPVVFALPVKPEQTFAEIWAAIEARYKRNYLTELQAQNFVIKKLQDLQRADLDLSDTVGAIYNDESTLNRVLHVIQADLRRELSVPVTSNLRPAHERKRALQYADSQPFKRRKLQEERLGFAVEDLHPDLPVKSQERDAEERNDERGERYEELAGPADLRATSPSQGLVGGEVGQAGDSGLYGKAEQALHEQDLMEEEATISSPLLGEVDSHRARDEDRFLKPQLPASRTRNASGRLQSHRTRLGPPKLPSNPFSSNATTPECLPRPGPRLKAAGNAVVMSRTPERRSLERERSRSIESEPSQSPSPSPQPPSHHSSPPESRWISESSSPLPEPPPQFAVTEGSPAAVEAAAAPYHNGSAGAVDQSDTDGDVRPSPLTGRKALQRLVQARIRKGYDPDLSKPQRPLGHQRTSEDRISNASMERSAHSSARQSVSGEDEADVPNEPTILSRSRRVGSYEQKPGGTSPRISPTPSADNAVEPSPKENSMRAGSSSGERSDSHHPASVNGRSATKTTLTNPAQRRQRNKRQDERALTAVGGNRVRKAGAKWTAEEEEILRDAVAKGLTFAQIHQQLMPYKTTNALRKKFAFMGPESGPKSSTAPSLKQNEAGNRKRAGARSSLLKEQHRIDHSEGSNHESIAEERRTTQSPSPAHKTVLPKRKGRADEKVRTTAKETELETLERTKEEAKLAEKEAGKKKQEASLRRQIKANNHRRSEEKLRQQFALQEANESAKRTAESELRRKEMDALRKSREESVTITHSRPLRDDGPKKSTVAEVVIYSNSVPAASPRTPGPLQSIREKMCELQSKERRNSRPSISVRGSSSNVSRGLSEQSSEPSTSRQAAPVVSKDTRVFPPGFGPEDLAKLTASHSGQPKSEHDQIQLRQATLNFRRNKGKARVIERTPPKETKPAVPASKSRDSSAQMPSSSRYPSSADPGPSGTTRLSAASRSQPRSSNFSPSERASSPVSIQPPSRLLSENSKGLSENLNTPKAQPRPRNSILRPPNMSSQSTHVQEGPEVQGPPSPKAGTLSAATPDAGKAPAEKDDTTAQPAQTPGTKSDQDRDANAERQLQESAKSSSTKPRLPTSGKPAESKPRTPTTRFPSLHTLKANASSTETPGSKLPSSGQAEARPKLNGGTSTAATITITDSSSDDDDDDDSSDDDGEEGGGGRTGGFGDSGATPQSGTPSNRYSRLASQTWKVFRSTAGL